MTNTTQRKDIHKKRLRNLAAIIVIVIIGVCVWKGIRASCSISFKPADELPYPTYSENDRVINAISLSYFVYGCEACDKLSGTVTELLEQNNMGILTENFGIRREVQSDPSSAVFDTSEFIRNFVGDYRFLTEMNDEKSGFYGAAFCDDRNKCVWISYSGSVSFNDAVSCVALVLKPGLSAQEQLALKLFESVLENDEVQNLSYSVMLTGHSLGGALAAMVSRVSGCTAVTINGADGLAIDKANDILGETPAEYKISNYMTSPQNGKFSLMDLVQRLMFLGSYKSVDCHVYSENGLTTDTHSVFSFVTFPNDDFSNPEIPDL